MNSVFLKDFTIIHHAKVMGHQLFKEDRKHFALSGLEDVEMPVAVNIGRVGFNGETKMPSVKSLLECDSEDKLGELTKRGGEKVKNPNVLPLPPFVLESITSMENPLIAKAFVLAREALAKRDRIVAAREDQTVEREREEEEEEDAVPPPAVEIIEEIEKMIAALQWL